MQDGFFKEESIGDLNDTLEGVRREGYRWIVNQRVKLMSANSERFLGYANKMMFSVTRQMAPIYSIGDVNPRQFIHGRRSIAGTIEIPATELIQFYVDQPMRAIYEEVVGDETVQIIMDGLQLVSQGNDVTMEDIIHSEDDEWTFIARTVILKRIPVHNKGYAKALLKKEWIPAWPYSAESTDSVERI